MRVSVGGTGRTVLRPNEVGTIVLTVDIQAERPELPADGVDLSRDRVQDLGPVERQVRVDALDWEALRRGRRVRALRVPKLG